MSSPRIAVAGVWHETNVFGPHLATLERFEEYESLEGADIVKRHQGVKTVIGGFLDGIEEGGGVAVPTFSAGAWPGGPAPARVLAELLARLAQSIRDAHGEHPLDGVLLNLHGAMTAEVTADVEAAVVRVVREIVGPDVPIGAVLDLHANPTKQFVTQCNVVICYDTYPHVDMWERGVEVASLILEAVRGRHLRTTIRRSSLLTLPAAQGTADEPMAGIRQRALSAAAATGAGRISICAGFAYTVPERIGLSALVVHDESSTSLAEDLAVSVIRDIEAHAQEFTVTRPTVRDAVTAALEDSGDRPVILADLADNIGGGSAGDGTALLSELLDRGGRGIFAIIADPEIAEQAHSIGVGRSFSGALGGKFDRLHGQPIHTTATVVTVTDGAYVGGGSYMTGQSFDMGPTALLDLGNGAATVLVTTRPTPPFHIEQYTHAGVDPTSARYIIAKGAIAWRSAYEDIAGTVIEVDTPGACALDIFGLQESAGIG